MYDIIGDIHGHSGALSELLSRLGYKISGDSYAHLKRKAIFVGDLVNKGPDSRTVVSIVRKMVQTGAAECVLGNHEYNLIASLRGEKKLLPNYEKLCNQASPTLKSYKDHKSDLESDLEWMHTLPLFLEYPGFRIVHACWDDDCISYLKEHYPENRFSKMLFHRSLERQNKEKEVVHKILNGPVVQVPKNLINKSHPFAEKEEMKIKWWINEFNPTYKNIAVKHLEGLPEIPVSGSGLKIGYPETDPPVFFGHYCLSGTPRIQTNNVCCVDYCISKNGHLSSYLWNGEKYLDNRKFITHKVPLSFIFHFQRIRRQIEKIGKWLNIF